MHRLSTTIEDFRRSAGLLPTGVCVITAATEHDVRGMTANSVTTVSLRPLLLSCCLRRGGAMHNLVQDAGALTVNVLAADQEDLARHFATPGRPSGEAQFAPAAWRPGPETNAPLLLGAVTAFECTVQDLTVAGDHSIFICEVEALHRGQAVDPLVFVGGRYRRFASEPTIVQPAA